MTYMAIQKNFCPDARITGAVSAWNDPLASGRDSCFSW